MAFSEHRKLVDFQRRRMLEVLRWASEQNGEPFFLQHEDTGEVIDLMEFVQRLGAAWEEDSLDEAQVD